MDNAKWRLRDTHSTRNRAGTLPAILILRGRAVLNPRFPMKPRWIAPLREGGCPGGAGGSIPRRANNRRHEVLPPALRATPLSEGGNLFVFRNSAGNQHHPKTDRIHPHPVADPDASRRVMPGRAVASLRSRSPRESSCSWPGRGRPGLEPHGAPLPGAGR